MPTKLPESAAMTTGASGERAQYLSFLPQCCSGAAGEGPARLGLTLNEAKTSARDARRTRSFLIIDLPSSRRGLTDFEALPDAPCAIKRLPLSDIYKTKVLRRSQGGAARVNCTRRPRRRGRP